MPISRRLVRLLLVLRAARIVIAQPYVTLVNDSSGTWWFSHLGKQFLSFAVNHANNGNPFDDGVGGREREVCRAATGNNLCGDSLNFGGKLGYAPYFNVTQDKYGPDESAWANASIARVLSWGFNGISGWSHTVAESAARSAGAYYYHLLDAGITWPHAGNGLDFDAWSANFSQQIAVIVAREVPPRANDTQLIAWQTDNENGFASVGIATYVKTYAASTGGAVLITWLQTRYNASIASLNSAWGTHANGWTSADIASQLPAPNAAAFNADNDDWIAAVVDRYLNITVTEIRKYDTNHLISGVRFSYNSKQIVAAAAKWCDMIDQHDYADLPGVDWLRQIHEVSGRPVILGEFSFTAADSNLPNTHGARAGNPETTQTRRAAKYVAYAKALVTLPFVVGYGWWNFVDEPATGRWPDGEDSNYGLVTLADDVYTILTNAMTDVHASANAWHATGVAPCSNPGSNYTLVPLTDWYSAARFDHFVSAGTECVECPEGLYANWGVVGWVYAHCVPGAVPLALYYDFTAQDNALLVQPPPRHGDTYRYVNVQAFALSYSQAHSGSSSGVGAPIPATLYSVLGVNASGKLDYRAVVGPGGLANATGAGYENLGPIATVFSTQQ